ncbi:MAG: type II toxin-antitoxin system PemK/MazF family toxin [Coleofasciculus sp. Co-bin14]|nr:type II toxin-antitoxin system PemK/MazF family toxin [Coleofasciculus sp. Co-bin14]
MDSEADKEDLVRPRLVRRGQIYWIVPNESRRTILPIRHPHVVVQDDLFNLSRISTVVMCGITSNLRRASEPGTVLLEPGEGGLERQSIVIAAQISSVYKSHLGEYIGMLSEQRVEQILSSLRFLQRAFIRDR